MILISLFPLRICTGMPCKIWISKQTPHKSTDKVHHTCPLKFPSTNFLLESVQVAPFAKRSSLGCTSNSLSNIDHNSMDNA